LHPDGRTGLAKSKPLFAKLRVCLKSEKPRSESYVIMIGFSQVVSRKEAMIQRIYFCLFPASEIYITIYILFVFIGYIDLP
jgi:hypothetical protein